jgi:hypothetical protein
LVLPTRVNIINDSSDRIKVKIDNDRDSKPDENINIEPGGRFDGIEGSLWWKSDVIVDVIINPAGPDNNTGLGGFKFDNPSIGWPNAKSDQFTTLRQDVVRIDQKNQSIFYLVNNFDRKFDRRSYWGMLDGGLLDNSLTFGAQLKVLVNTAQKPTFTVDAFYNDDEVGAKVWDLRVNSDNFTL